MFAKVFGGCIIECSINPAGTLLGVIRGIL